MKQFDVIIVGGGQGGARAAMALRQFGFMGSVALLGDEPELPYDRPPLSKEYLAGEKAWDRLVFRDAAAWDDKQITILTRHTVVRVDPAARMVATESDGAFGYRFLIWAAGGCPRRLACAGSDLVGVHTVRSRADVDRMVSELPVVEEVAVIGGGYIGLEAAAVLTKLGKKVTVLEALPRVLARVAGEPLSRFFEREHRSHGVDLRVEAQVEAIDDRDGRAEGVRLADGSRVAAQMVIVGIGILPSTRPLLDAGADGEGAVRVDTLCRTSLPDIFAIGDCAEHRSVWAGDDWIRLESVQNANDQATCAAKAICGTEEPYEAIPWFWSNQYDLRLQTIGISRGFDDCVVRGDPDSRSFSVVYLREGGVIALDCVNAVRDYSQGRAMVASRARPDRAALADAAQPLKSLL